MGVLNAVLHAVHRRISDRKVMLVRILQWITSSLVVGLALFFPVLMVCDSTYFWYSSNNPTTAFCESIYTVLWTPSAFKGFPMWPPTTVLTMLLLLLPCFIFLVPQSVTTTRHLSRDVNPIPDSKEDSKEEDTKITRWDKLRVVLTKGDPSIRLWALVTIVLPILIVMGIMLSKHSKKKTQISRLTSQWANPAGYCASIALALFLVPVAKQSPLLTAIGWSSNQALGMHVWAGRVCWIMTSIHGLLYAVKYGLSTKHDGSFWQKMYKGLVPSTSDCWQLQSILAFESGSNCYHEWRNVTGCISGFFLFVLVMTSWNFIRRWNYRFFYISHIISGSFMLLFAIYHYYWIALYITPGLIYYLACSTPIVVQQAANLFLDNGTMLKESRLLSKSNGCMELVFASNHCRQHQVATPAYVRICVPEISLLWHPFTVPHSLQQDGDLKLLVRRYGFFTTKLYQRLQSKHPPTMLVDGFYPGTDWAAKALEHDTVLLVAGGIGVTPMLPVLLELHQHLIKNSGKTQLVTFHWYCRDEGLVLHVLQHYLAALFIQNDDKKDETAASCQFEVKIHLTSRQVDDAEPFILAETDTETENAEKENAEMKNDSEELFVDEPLEEVQAITTTAAPVMKDPPKDLKMDYSTHAKGVPMQAASFSHITASSRLVVLVGLMAFAGVYSVHLWFYVSQVWVHKERIFFRAYGLYAVIFLIVIMAILMEYLRRKVTTKQGGDHLPLTTAMAKEDMDDEDLEKAHTEKIPVLPFEGRSGKTCVHISVSNGRPFVNDVIHPAVEAELPGAFYCGPAALLTPIQKEISSERTKVKGRLAPRCCTYQEHFEI